jgi:hypothetical protein
LSRLMRKGTPQIGLGEIGSLGTTRFISAWIPVAKLPFDTENLPFPAGRCPVRAAAAISGRTPLPRSIPTPFPELRCDRRPAGAIPGWLPSFPAVRLHFPPYASPWSIAGAVFPCPAPPPKPTTSFPIGRRGSASAAAVSRLPTFFPLRRRRSERIRRHFLVIRLHSQWSGSAVTSVPSAYLRHRRSGHL